MNLCEWMAEQDQGVMVMAKHSDERQEFVVSENGQSS